MIERHQKAEGTSSAEDCPGVSGYEAPPENTVLVSIERAGSETYRIRSDQLEAIGQKLRGRHHFSVFNSIILPAIVSVVTIVVSSLFQFVSWRNSVALQKATDIADRASESYEKAAGAIGERTYATVIFLPSIRDLVREKHALSAVRLVESPPKAASFDRETSGAGPAASESVAQAGESRATLDRFDLELKKKRFESYYEQLRRWNENYDQRLTDVDYSLDRPILILAGLSLEGVSVYGEKLNKINCDLSLTN